MKHAPNKQAEAAKRSQTVEVPEDIRQSAITSPAILSLCRLRGGDLIAELDDDLRKAVAESMMLGKKSEITIKLKIAPDGHKRVSVSDLLTVKLPKPDAGSTAMFATAGGQLLAYDPEQMEMDLKTVSITTAEARDPLKKASGQ